MTTLLSATQLVNEKFNQLETMAGTTYDTTLAAINALAELASDLEVINEHVSIDVTPITINPIILTAPTVNDADLVVTIPPDPEAPVLVDDTLLLSDLPSFPTLTTSAINPGDNTYSSTLLTALRTKLQSDLASGSTGIEPAIEDAIWRREEERSLQALEDSLDRKASLWAEVGWDLPNDQLGAMVQEEQLTFLNNRLTQSRDISIKSADLALANSHFVIQQGVAFEGMLMQWVNWVAQRIFEASKAVVDAQIAKFQGEVNVATAKTDAILRTAMTRIQYNVGKIQLYSSQISAFTAKLQSEDVRVGAVAKAVTAKTEIYRSTADFLIGKAGLDIKLIDAKLQQATGNMNLLIHDKDIRMSNYHALNQLRVQALDALGRITSQLMAGIWSGVSAGASISAGSSYSESTQTIIEE